MTCDVRTRWTTADLRAGDLRPGDVYRYDVGNSWRLIARVALRDPDLAEPCPCVATGPAYSNVGNPDHDGSPDLCDQCDSTGEIPASAATQMAAGIAAGMIPRQTPSGGPVGLGHYLVKAWLAGRVLVYVAATSVCSEVFDVWAPYDLVTVQVPDNRTLAQGLAELDDSIATVHDLPDDTEWTNDEVLQMLRELRASFGADQ